MLNVTPAAGSGRVSHWLGEAAQSGKVNWIKLFWSSHCFVSAVWLLVVGINSSRTGGDREEVSLETIITLAMFIKYYSLSKPDSLLTTALKQYCWYSNCTALVMEPVLIMNCSTISTFIYWIDWEWVARNDSNFLKLFLRSIDWYVTE